MVRYKIKHVVLSRLHNEEYFGFHSEFMKLAGTHHLAGMFQDLLGLYQVNYAKLEASLEAIRQSVYTQHLSDTDVRRCEVFFALRFMVESLLRHSNRDKQLAAERVANILHHYRKTHRLSREEKTYSLVNLIQNLREGLAADLQLLGLNELVDELAAVNRTYQDQKEMRYIDREKQTAKQVQIVRRALDDDYRAIEKQLDVYGKLKPNDADFVALARGLNERVGFYNQIVAQRIGISASRRKGLKMQGAEGQSVRAEREEV